jgi:hypothetical protein
MAGGEHTREGMGLFILKGLSGTIPEKSNYEHFYLHFYVYWGYLFRADSYWLEGERHLLRLSTTHVR